MILEAMYNGEYYPCETVVVQELRAQTAIAQCEESESHFKYGFSAGLMFSRKPMNKCSRRKKNG